MRITRLLGLLVLLSALFSVGCGEDSPDSQPVAESVSEQLGYLEPQSSLVAAVDLRFAEENWEHVQTLVSRGLREYRNVDPDAGLEVPPNLDGALNQAAGFAGLSFEDDVEPLLDGYLVVGLTVVGVEPGSGAGEVEPEQRTVVTYRTKSDGMQEVIGKLTEGDELRRIPGHDGALLIDSSSALIGGDTIVFVDAPDGDGPDGASDALLAALDRAESGKGFSADELETAQEQTGSTDPLILSAGDLSLGGLLIEGPGLRRAIEDVPLLGAVQSTSASVDIDEEGLRSALRIATDPGQLTAEDVPLGASGPIELPARDDAIVGASRNQSATTVFATKLARSLFADSQFVRAVEATERKLDIDFEQEFLRQFDCPSVSVLDATDTRRFAARSCVQDPERMRALLPRLAPELPKILTALQRLEGEGLVALLLIAPDAPLTPSFGDLLAAIELKPLGGPEGEDSEQLYELRGLRDPGSRLAFSGPDRVVFGMIGDDFVVGSDREQVSEIADVETEKYPDEAASATTVPAPVALAATDEVAGELASRLIGDLSVSASGDRSGVDLDLVLPFAGD
jgi:hypothetical protein